MENHLCFLFLSGFVKSIIEVSFACFYFQIKCCEKEKTEMKIHLCFLNYKI